MPPPYPDRYEEWEDEWPTNWPDITLTVTEPEIVATLYGPRGEPMLVFYDRNSVPFGFQVP